MTPADSPTETPPAAAPDSRSSRYSIWLRLEAFVERMFILLGIYVLSIGPMYWEWYRARHVRGAMWVAAFYEPLRIFGEACPLFGKCLNWYIRLWIG